MTVEEAIRNYVDENDQYELYEDTQVEECLVVSAGV